MTILLRAGTKAGLQEAIQYGKKGCDASTCKSLHDLNVTRTAWNKAAPTGVRCDPRQQTRSECEFLTSLE